MIDPAGLGLLIVAGAVLIVVIFFFAYYNTLMLIASFTSSNARIKAIGIPFVQKERIKKLVDSKAREELVEALRTSGYAISSSESGADGLEKALDREGMEILRSTVFSLPKGAKPFFDAYMLKYDAEAIKRVIRAKKMGKKIEIEEIALYSLDRRVIEEMLESGTVDDAKNALHATIFSKAAAEQDDFAFESALDRIVFEKISEAVFAVDGDISKTLGVFTGVLLDMSNIKIVLRAKSMGIKGEDVLALIMGEGRELAEWRLKNMAEAQDIVSAVSELSGTPYSDALKGLSSVEEIEKALDEYLLKRTSELAMENSLSVGPAIHFFVGKEMEMRNIKAVNIAIENGLSWDDVEQLAVAEVAP